MIGIDTTVARPDSFAPTPWETYTYDANDNAGRTHGTSASSYQSHWNTPASSVVDALGRVVQAIERDGPNAPADWYVTRTKYDITGNVLTITDPLGRLAFRYVHDLAKHAVYTEQLDAGLRRVVLDAAGSTVEQRDSKGALILHSFDELHRPLRLWAGNGTGQEFTLRERIIYGDSSDAQQDRVSAAPRNLLGRPYRQYDEAGLLISEAYDLKGNLLESTRQVISDATILKVFDRRPEKWEIPAFCTDWNPPEHSTVEQYSKSVLDPLEYRISRKYDALNRAREIPYPLTVENTRPALKMHYDRRGSLDRLDLSGVTYVRRIIYNAKEQRTLIHYGNNVVTRCRYDDKTFRLAELRSEHVNSATNLTFVPDAPRL